MKIKKRTYDGREQKNNIRRRAIPFNNAKCDNMQGETIIK